MEHDRDILINSAVVNADIKDYDSIATTSTDVARSHELHPPKKFTQIFAAFAATLSALSAGMVLGWTSPAMAALSNGDFRHIKMTDIQIGWAGSFATLGGMTMCIPTGFLSDLIGRKKTLLLLTVPFVFGWSLIIWAQGLVMLYFGRLMTGMAAGACCVVSPLYTGEIAHKSLRGTLGSFFQLMVVTGIFLAYLFGKFMDIYSFTILCGVTPLLFALVFAFQPESPVYLLKKGEPEQSKRALIYLRGAEYDVDAELTEIEGNLKETLNMTVSFKETFSQRCVYKAVIISFALMFFQQMCGINAVVLYTSGIFKETGSKIDPNSATIVVGLCQVVSTLLSSVIIDRTGRKPLLLTSTSVVAVNTLLLGVYFSLKMRVHLSDDVLMKISFLPIGALSLYVIAYSLGLGPIPWMIASEIFPVKIRSIVSSVAGTFNWLLAFLMTKFYLEVSEVIGDDTAFYIFTVITVIGTIFVAIVVPETKGKNIDEIQEILQGRQ